MKIVRTKSIPNVDTPRLLDSLTQLHRSLHTQDGLRTYSGTRRGMIEGGWKIIAITNELERRDVRWPDCRHCVSRPYEIGRNEHNRPVAISRA